MSIIKQINLPNGETHDIIDRLFQSGGDASIASGADLNTYTTLGTYSATGSVASSLVNAPFTGGSYGCKLLVMGGYGEKYIHQIILRTNSQAFWYRSGRKDGSEWIWTEWVNLAQDTTYSAAGSSLGLVKSGGDVTISSGTITVNDDSHNHTIENVDELQSILDNKENNVYKQIIEPLDAPINSLWIIGNESKNLFHSNVTSTTKNGVTITYDKDTQEITLNGTLSAAGDLPVADKITLDWISGNTYTLSARYVSGTATLASGGSTTYAWSIFNSNASKYIRGSTSLASFNELYIGTGTAFDGTATVYLQCWRVGTVFTDYKVKI